MDKILIDKLNEINDLHRILETICETSGMGFAAIARVTDVQWFICVVRDRLGYNLKPGDQLPLETTLCNEVRQHHLPIVIDDVEVDRIYNDHHTPKRYGFQSYISVPLILSDGTFFGTLCAVDKKPREIEHTDFRQMFDFFAKAVVRIIEELDR